MQTAEMIFELVERQPVLFERWILGRMMYDSQFASAVSSVLFMDHEAKEARAFQMPKHTGLAMTILGYHQMNGNTKHISAELLWYCMTNMAAQAKLPSAEDELAELWQFLQQTMADTVANWNTVQHMTNTAVVYWLKRIRMQTATSRAKSENWNADRLQLWLRKEGVHISRMAKTEQTSSDIWQCHNNPGPDVQRLPCSIPRVNTGLGGGPGRGEGTLFVCASGAGKTVATTQLAGEWCVQGKKGVIITTEPSQGAKEMSLRIISQQCRIPFSQIVNGLRLETLQPDQREEVARLQHFIRPDNLQVIEWFKRPNTSAVESMDEVLEEVASRMGGLDFFILDWIGGALGADSANDPAKLRLIFQSAANKVAAMASTFDCVGVGTAQAHNVTGKNKARVVAADARECKSMDQDMTNVIGISAILDKSHDDADGGENYVKEQFWFISKARKSAGGLAPVSRKFEYQLFVPRAGKAI